MRSLPLAALLLGGIIGGSLGASALSAGPMPKMPDVLSDVMPAGWGGGPKNGHHGHGPRHGGPGPMGGMMMRMAREADTDKDKALTQEEIDAYVAAKVQLGDANGDGNLSLDEFQTVWLSIMRPQMVDQFQELDEDGDGVVTLEERTLRFGDIVERMDRNGDGKVDRADFRGGRGKGHDRDRGDREERRGDREERGDRDERREERRAEREERREERRAEREARRAADQAAPAPAAPAPAAPAAPAPAN